MGRDREFVELLVRIADVYADADRERHKAQRENAKLRELVRAAWKCIHSGLSCSDCRMVAGGCTLKSAMRELGVEVDG